MRNTLGLAMLAAVLLLPSSCSDCQSTWPGPTPPLEEISEQAQLMALYLSNEVHPPVELSWQVEQDLAYIRSVHGDDHPMLRELKFMPLWEPSVLLIGVTVEAARQIEEGEYDAWDDLNETYRVGEIENHLGGSTPFVVCHFTGLLHPGLVVTEYATLPGVRWAQPSGYAGDWSNVYPLLTDSGVTYLFRRAWGDCLSGCTSAEYWYFARQGSLPSYEGVWNSDSGEPQPRWWDEAKRNERHFKDSWPAG